MQGLLAPTGQLVVPCHWLEQHEQPERDEAYQPQDQEQRGDVRLKKPRRDRRDAETAGIGDANAATTRVG
jgi:hypothetical protein